MIVEMILFLKTYTKKNNQDSWQNLNLKKVFVDDFVFDLFCDQCSVDSKEYSETEQPFAKFRHILTKLISNF